jgi:hypothetical protein
MKKLTLLTCLTLFAAGSLFAQQDSAVVDRMEDRLKSEELNVGLLLQTVGVFSFEDDNFNGGRAYQLGATRLDVRGQLPSNFSYRLQLDFRRAPSILDAQVGYRFSDQFRIVGGAFKPFLSAELDPNPGDTDFINRARLVGAMMNSREIGVTVLGESNGLNYRFGMYNGNGLQGGNDNRFMYTSRVGYTVQADAGTFNFGVNGAINTSVGESVGNTGLISAGDRVLYGAFVKYDSDAFFGAIEFLQTDFEILGVGLDETITGFYATLGNNITDRDQILARWDHLSFDLTGQSSERIVLGWNHQATQLVSFQVNLLGQFNKDDDNQLGISGNFQFQF